MQNIYFTPGPAAIFPTLSKHIQEAFELQIPSISHRSETFRKIYQECYQGLKQLFNLPDNTAVVFASSATEIWERLIWSCVENHSLHLINGAFSKKFYETAQQLQKKPSFYEVEAGKGFDISTIQIEKNIELLALTHNETSTGVSMPVEDIHRLAEQNEQGITALDIVSSAPYAAIDFRKVDTAFFSVQKSFGLPAGLGVWIVNEKCVKKSAILEKKGLLTGTYHRLTQFWKYFEKFETPSTPNVLAIYLLNKVTQDMLKMGIENIRIQTEQKAKKLYDLLENHDYLEAFVKNKAHQSKTVVVANVKNGESTSILKKLKEKNMVVGSGYGEFKNAHLRIANFIANEEVYIDALINELKNN
ncbi:MAG: alanine--glyoxylate aminotransferase family protein [Cytophagia bacterium]|nr:MAG: alanine--glyoxylate aminotransferase family protein [Cytophagales bacterium]TAG07060.1 MAG: alanine--glyoxylate aminotransferase family protein [Cytophagia bacterium]TAG44739.1 MAG: alanine--glyoxylate aminotransferase family protein [Cytophagia bacterium]